MASKYLSELSAAGRSDLEARLLAIQKGLCFICELPINYELQKHNLDVDHVQPLADQGNDDPSNFALTHGNCNKSKQAADLRVARMMARFDKIRLAALDAGRDAPNLDDVLGAHSGAKRPLLLSLEGAHVSYVFPHLEGAAANEVHRSELYTDQLSGMRYFFGLFPLAYLHHDDRINPRGIGSSLRGLVEEFFRRRPQLHVSLGWVTTSGSETGKLRIFDGQHKAAAQILLGTKLLPVRVFVDPDPDLLLQANTNAGSRLRQVAFDKSIQRHLGSALFHDRVERLQREKQLQPDDYSFSEEELVKFFSGEASEMKRYILDNVRDRITTHQDNRLRPYIDLGGRANVKPLSYSTVDKTFYSFFIGSSLLSGPLDAGMDAGLNPRDLEVEQIVRLMNIVAQTLFEEQFEFERGTYRLENRIQKDEDIPLKHMRAFRMAKEETLYAWLSFVSQVVTQFYVVQGVPFSQTRLFQVRHPDAVWSNIENYVKNLAGLPLWFNNALSLTVFGGKQNYEFWNRIFTTGKSPQGQQVLAEPINLLKMVQG